jgi:hypothetical protein
MKGLLILAALTIPLFAGGCADPLEHQSGSDLQGQLERGVTGQGNIGPEQREPGDPAAEHGVPQTHP